MEVRGDGQQNGKVEPLAPDRTGKRTHNKKERTAQCVSDRSTVVGVGWSKAGGVTRHPRSSTMTKGAALLLSASARRGRRPRAQSPHGSRRWGCARVWDGGEGRGGSSGGVCSLCSTRARLKWLRDRGRKVRPFAHVPERARRPLGCRISMCSFSAHRATAMAPDQSDDECLPVWTALPFFISPCHHC